MLHESIHEARHNIERHWSIDDVVEMHGVLDKIDLARKRTRAKHG